MDDKMKANKKTALGFLAYKSEMFPEWMGTILIISGIWYLIDLFQAFLFPDFGQKIHTFIIIFSAIAEILMVLYLLVVGVKTQHNPIP